VTRNLLFR